MRIVVFSVFSCPVLLFRSSYLLFLSCLIYILERRVGSAWCLINSFYCSSYHDLISRWHRPENLEVSSSCLWSCTYVYFSLHYQFLLLWGLCNLSSQISQPSLGFSFLWWPTVPHPVLNAFTVLWLVCHTILYWLLFYRGEKERRHTKDTKITGDKLWPFLSKIFSFSRLVCQRKRKKKIAHEKLGDCIRQAWGY